MEKINQNDVIYFLILLMCIQFGVIGYYVGYLGWL